MDKYEYRTKTGQMLGYMDKRNYRKAMEIADEIDWKRIRNASTLCSVSEIYEYNGEYQKSRDILFIAYDRSPGSRKIVYRLGTLALKIGDVNEAMDCYEEFIKLAPKDPNQYILRYKILKAQNAPLDEQIETLEEFKKAEYIEKWAFELAKLYHEAGRTTECLAECDDLILWFSDGKFVFQAMELKQQYKPLTPLQQEKYDHRNDSVQDRAPVNRVMTPEELEREKKKEELEEEIPAEYRDGGEYASDNFGVERIVDDGEEPSENGESDDMQNLDFEVRAVGDEKGEGAEEKPPHQTSDITKTVRGATLAEALANGIAAVRGKEKENPVERPMEQLIEEELDIDDILNEWESKQEDEEPVSNEEETIDDKLELEEPAQEKPTWDKGTQQSETEKAQKAMEEKPEEEELEEVDSFDEKQDEEKDLQEEDDFQEVDLSKEEEPEVEELEEEEPEEEEFGEEEPEEELEEEEPEEELEEEPEEELEEEPEEELEEEEPEEEFDDADDFVEQGDFEEDEETDEFMEEADIEEEEESKSVQEADIEEEEPQDKATDMTQEELEIEDEIEERMNKSEGGVSFDTGFVVQGRYDLEAQSEIGLKAGLTEEQKELFSYFVPVRGMSEQIVEVLDNDKRCKDRYGTSGSGNLLIIGRRGTGKTVLAVDVIKALQKNRKMKKGKVAIVTADVLNKKELPSIIQKLKGGALIIEKASRLTSRTITELNELLEGQTGEMYVVLEDQRKAMEKLLKAQPQFAKKFTSKLELPVFINDELVTFGQTYAKENGYRIDEMGILALYSRIDMMQREDHAVTVAEVKVIMDEAIEHSQKGNMKHLFKRMAGKNTDERNRVILQEQDFNK